ncbi:uncharacterized protein LOC123524892 [Mercenaria mercenaria]|uniref:uncharacterized protein LOC123524892 n=1 Tax=Mercenaria mercenaria TaxID=6596 RepID=UPI00234E704D|nr:uncharacterized protein LOC123524892 [Mercenaria mercenaria]XP_053394434.1 uncharacterized protein LOC123524892 [Mercenaria mercenaria]XP_053394435.1 uncharacterized protein LOC123524892 [Mercenaria mercenaria]
MATVQSNTRKRVYYYRLQTLLIDGGTEVIRNVFDQKINIPLTVHLTNNHTTILQLKKKRIINQKQYDTLFSAPVLPKPLTSADLDITMLTCLLQHTCGLLKSTPNSVWFSTPAQNDTSLEAEIVRMRHFRNELAHKKSIPLLQQYFSAMWSEIETVLLRLNGSTTNSISNLQATINAFKTGTVDEESQERNDQLLEDWGEMDKTVLAGLEEVTQMLHDERCRTTAVVKEVTEIRENIQAIQHKVSPRLESLKVVSQRYFNKVKERKDLFVKTDVYQLALKRFNTSGIAILSGYAGEGKTTVASQMLLETCPVNKILKLSTPKDWKQLNVKDKDWNGIFIDDIFGSDAFDPEKMKGWKPYLDELQAEAHGLNLLVVITTRQNILNEAKDHRTLDLFKEENVTILSSSDLSKEEKKNILWLHLQTNKRECPPSSLNSCVSRWKDDECKVGFPECAVMFAQNDTLFRKGAEFFAAPFEFFRKCLSELSKNEDEFMILVLLWTKSSRKLSKFDLEPTHIHSLLEIAAELNYPLEEKSRTLRKTLDHHKGGFLSLTDRKDEYTFSHSVIGDVVGLVTGEEYPDVAIKYGPKSFVLNYVQTRSSDSKNCILVDDRRYSVLSKRLNQLLFEKKERSSELDSTLKKPTINNKGIENTRISQSNPDVSVLEHEAFNNETFVREHIDPTNGNDIVTTPILEVYKHFRNPYCIVFENGHMGMCMPAFYLARKNEIMVTECIKRNMLTDREKYIALLFATRDNNEMMVRKLIEAGAKVNEDALHIATVNQNIGIMKLLLHHFSQLNATNNHIQKRNSQLITATKRHSLKAVTCLLQSDVDVNYTNEDGLSALDKAVICKNVAICETLVKKGCKLDEKSGKFKRTPLHKAVDLGCFDIVKLLLNAGSSVDTTDHRGEYPIHSAAIRGHTEIVRTLLDKDRTLAVKPFSFRGKVYYKNSTLFHYAVWKEDEILLNLLKEFEIDSNIQDGYGRTPLYLATYYNKPKFVELMIDKANVKIADRNGSTPLHAAAFKMFPELVELLCRFYTDIRMVDRNGNTVFHVLKNSSENASSIKGNTCCDIRENLSKCVKILLEKDAEFEYALRRMKNKKGIIVSVECENGVYSLTYYRGNI